MLSGKFLNSVPCSYSQNNTGNCSGCCAAYPWQDMQAGDQGVHSPANESAALAECNDWATYFGGSCLGITEVPEENRGSGDLYTIWGCMPTNYLDGFCV
jgi:hypothetical protein